MKITLLFALSICVSAVCPADVAASPAACPASRAAGREKPYDFRARLACVHEPNRRDWKRRPAKDDFVFQIGAKIAIPAAAPALVARAANDFADYLAVSMGLNASVAVGDSQSGGTPLSQSPKSKVQSPKPAVTLALDSTLPPRTYATSVSAAGVAIRAFDAKAAAQALYHLEDRMNLRRAPFLKFGDETRRPRFSPRMSHSGWGCDQFPDAHLAQMAHYGLDAVLVFVKDVDVTKNLAHNDVADVIRRAKAWGLDTYIYSYVVAFAHPDDPGAKELYEKTYGRIAAAYPEAKGIIFVGESCQFPSKDERALPLCYWQKKEIAAARAKGDHRSLAGWFPCRDYAQWLNAVRAAINAHAPNMEIVFWSYNWGYHPQQARYALLDTLPQDVTMQATFEMFETFKKRNGLKSETADYSLSFVGPGKYFTSEAKYAHEHGRRMYAMTNTGGHTWDFGTIPFDPFPYQWQKRFDAVAKAHDEWGLAGVMENHHYGWWPSFVSELAKERYTEGGMAFDEQIAAIAARDFGEENVKRVLATWKDWSEKIVDMHATSDNQYGPFRYGPAYPFNAMEKPLEGSDLPLSPMYLHVNYGAQAPKNEALVQELELLEPMAESFAKGGADFLALADAATDAATRERARRMGWLGRYMACCCRTAVAVKKGVMAERAKDRARVVELARAELANCEEALVYVDADSRLGWEPTMLYRGGPDAIRWKIDYLKKHYGL